jgi:hypothetical protein
VTRKKLIIPHKTELHPSLSFVPPVPPLTIQFSLTSFLKKNILVTPTVPATVLVGIVENMFYLLVFPTVSNSCRATLLPTVLPTVPVTVPLQTRESHAQAIFIRTEVFAINLLHHT